MISGAEIVKHPDDAITPDVGGVAHRGTPIAVAHECALMEQMSIPRDQGADGVGVVMPDRIDKLASLHETWPTGRLVAPCEHELRIGELGVVRRNGLRMKLG